MKGGLGYGGILVGLVSAVALAIRAGLAGRGRDPGSELRARLRPVVVALLGATTASFVTLVVVLAGDDFSMRYAAEHSSRSTPTLYKVAAAWAGPPGRLLLAAAVLATGIGLLFRTVAEGDRLATATLGVLGAVEAGVLGLLATVANPFFPLTPVPGDGSGPRFATSPLGAVHPFLLTAGCALLAVPLALAIGARLSGHGRPEWASRARVWAGPAWALLTLAVLGQAWWLSSRLGWRGPWDTGSALGAGTLLWPAGTAVLLASRARRAPRPRWRAAGVLGVAIVCVPAVVLAARPAGPARVGAAAQAGGRDLSTVSISEMEEVISSNPTVVGMRLALSERYLRARRADDANAQASIALALDPPTAQRQEALKLLGWSAALLGRAQEGAAFLEQSLSIDATDRDATWFLANVRLVGLGDPAGAIPLIEQLLTGTMTADQRRTVEERLVEARLRALGPGGPALSLEPTARP